MNKVITSSLELKHFLKDYQSIGYVPTMGNLHDGHLSLLKKSLAENEISVISIYVNPTQFAANEDFDTYPRTLKEDISKIAALSKEIIIFAPKNDKEIYPQNKSIFKVDHPMTKILEGKLRPGHFDGVTTVVKRLFEIVTPTRAYFGKKDYQQYLIIKEMVKILNLDIEVIGLPIIREEDGLAMSSRNNYMSAEQRKAASFVSKTLISLKDQLEKNSHIEDFLKHLDDFKKNHPEFNYLELCDKKQLLPVNKPCKDLILLANYQMGDIKLLDNLEI